MSQAPRDSDRRRARKPKGARPKAVAPRAVPPKAVRPKAVPPKAVAPKAVPPKAVPPKAVSPRGARAARPARPKAPQPKVPAPQAVPADGAHELAAEPEACAPEADALIGQTIGRCRIEELIGVGRTARVYRAHYEALDDTVAIKILRRDVATNPVLVERFDSEARAIAKVDNENVLKIYDVGTTDDGLHYMVVELLEGEEILELIQREGTVEPMDALRIVRQAANGLAAAHAHHLVHRDVKPQNLFLLEDGTVKVVDFGLAAGIDDTGERVGTPHYMAPEVCEFAKAEPASDIYGLGVTLFHLLTGQPPYAGQDIKTILRAHIAGELLQPERRRPGLPRKVGDIVRLLTKRDPLMRPPALQVVDELDRFGGQELRQKDSLRKRRARSRARSAVARRERAGKGSPAVLAIFGLIVVVGIVIAFAVGSGSDDPPRPPERGGDVDPAPSQPGGDLVGPGRVDPVETPDAKKAREAAVERRERAHAAKQALERAEQWARENWHGPADTEAVLAKYRYVSDRWPGVPSAEEAKRRIKGIKAHKLHPHPDREWTSADELAVLRTTWKEARPRVEERIAAFDYEGARDLVPSNVSDESGQLSRELDFWREHTGYLIAYRRLLTQEVGTLGAEDRTLTTPEGEALVQGATRAGFQLKVGPLTKAYGWSQLGAETIAGLGMALVSGGEADRLILQVAFAFAHQLKKPFWDAQLELGFVAGVGPYERINKRYKAEAGAWAR